MNFVPGETGDKTMIRNALGRKPLPGMRVLLNCLLLAFALPVVGGLRAQADPAAWAWGWNYYGELGDGTTTSRSAPVAVSSLGGAVAIGAGYDYSLALKNDGTVWAWGRNDYGQLGDGTTTQQNTSVQVSGLSGVIAISAGGFHSLVLKSDGTVWAWGYNDEGELGDGTTMSRNTPVQVSGLSGVVAISGGLYHSLALKGDGTVWAWGRNGEGELGDGTTTDRSTPAQVSGLSGMTAISAGGEHSLALRGDGTVWAWGHNDSGQLGDGTTTDRHTPIQVSGLSGATAISVGRYHTLVLKGDGTVWAWGWNGEGELGDGTTTNRSTPVQVSGLDNVTAISAGAYHSLALKSDGTVAAWGKNGLGELGDGTTTTVPPYGKSTPVQVSGLSGAMAICAGWLHSLALGATAPAPPVSVTIATPADGSTVSGLTAISGSAQDDAGGDGIKSVSVVLHRIVNGSTQYWNGSAWTATPSYLYPMLSSPGAVATDWSLAADKRPAGADLPAGTYYLRAWAYDRGNRSVYSGLQSFKVAEGDTTAPVSVTIATPANGATISTLSSIDGSASDNAGGSGIKSVSVVLHRIVSGSTQYWNGSAWTATPSYLYPTLNSPGAVNTTWGVPSNKLPSISNLTNGTYYLRAWAYDRGNRSVYSGLQSFTAQIDTPGPVVFNPANGNYYQEIAVAGGIDWPEADAAARSRMYKGMSGHLVTLTSAQENQFVFGNMPNAIQGNWWIGGHQNTVSPEYSEPGGGWEWVTDEPFSYTNWQTNEPNNVNSQEQENYLQILLNGKWNDNVRAIKLGGYVIEYEDPAVADLLIKRSSESDESYGIDNVYQGVPAGDQIEAQGTKVGSKRVYQAMVENDSPDSRTLVLKAVEGAGTGWTIVYRKNASDISAALKSANGYTTAILAPGAGEIVTIEMTPAVGASASQATTLNAFLNSSDATVRDAVQAVATLDTTAPVGVTIATPASDSTVSGLSSISGSASDNVGGSGIKSVSVVLHRIVSGSTQYWNGSTWAATPSYLYPTLSNPGAVDTDWSLTTSELPSGVDLPAGTYYLRAWAYDQGNRSVYSGLQSFSVGAGAQSISPSSVKLQGVSGVVSSSRIVLTFDSGLQLETASDASHYAVTVGGVRAKVLSASYAPSTHRVTLQLPDGALRGGEIVVGYRDLRDANGNPLEQAAYAVEAE
jgi:alpha-tubulin suppressor-like RCC1 family protein